VRAAAARPSAPALSPAWLLTPGGAEYRLLLRKGEGTFSEVLKAQCLQSAKYVAIKGARAAPPCLAPLRGRWPLVSSCGGRGAVMKSHFDSLEQACPERVPGMRQAALARAAQHAWPVPA